jgi:hypothetical protein
MIYTLNHPELEKIAKVYGIEVSVLMEKINFQDDIISFLPYEKGIELKTENNESLILKFKDRTQ